LKFNQLELLTEVGSMQTVPMVRMPEIDYSLVAPEVRYRNGKFLVELLQRVKSDPDLNRILEAKKEAIRNEG
jgi:phage host-nuclease inhibitor protein Gam